jgi:Type III restriction enzyme, res subunit
MTFRKPWRVYQSRLLDHLGSYLQNNRLHLVAAPGSGKTVLGLEVIKRLNQPTLVLAPTITIRDQWVDRLVDLFLPPGSGKPAWVSTELRNPAFLTIATYQALHAVCSDEPEEPAQPSESEENGDSRNQTSAANTPWLPAPKASRFAIPRGSRNPEGRHGYSLPCPR